MAKNSTLKTNDKLSLDIERKRLRTLIETIPDLVWLKNVDGVYLFCNPKFEKLYGHEESYIIGKTDFDFVPADLAKFFRQKDMEALKAGKSTTNIEWLTYSDDGHREFVETIKTPMIDSDGNIIGILGIARDITTRYNAERNLKKFMMGIENSSDAIFTTDIDGTINFINPTFEKAYGFQSSEALGKTPRILKSGFISQEGYKNFWDTLLSGKAVNHSLLFLQSCQRKLKSNLLLLYTANSNCSNISNDWSLVKIETKIQVIIKVIFVIDKHLFNQLVFIYHE